MLIIHQIYSTNDVIKKLPITPHSTRNGFDSPFRLSVKYHVNHQKTAAMMLNALNTTENDPMIRKDAALRNMTQENQKKTGC